MCMGVGGCLFSQLPTNTNAVGSRESRTTENDNKTKEFLFIYLNGLFFEFFRGKKKVFCVVNFGVYLLCES